MVNVTYEPSFERTVRKIKDAALKERVKKHIAKIVAMPDIGKPMRYKRKGTREVHIPPFRLSYSYIDDSIVFLMIYHAQ